MSDERESDILGEVSAILDDVENRELPLTLPHPAAGYLSVYLVMRRFVPIIGIRPVTDQLGVAVKRIGEDMWSVLLEKLRAALARTPKGNDILIMMSPREVGLLGQDLASQQSMTDHALVEYALKAHQLLVASLEAARERQHKDKNP